jgi:uncharacterized protein YkwD
VSTTLSRSQRLFGQPLLLVVLALPAVFVPAGSYAGTGASRFDTAVLAGLNRIRASHGLKPLSFAAGLNRSARLQSREMLTGGYFSHGSPSGASFLARIERFDPSTLRRGSAGENLFWGQDPVTPAVAINSWMASPGHRANILDPSWRVIGLAALTSPDAPGVFGQRAVTVIAADFATNG